MRADRLRVGDVVEVNVRGTLVQATVTGFSQERRVEIEPLARWCTYRSVRLRDVRRRLNRRKRGSRS